MVQLKIRKKHWSELKLCKKQTGERKIGDTMKQSIRLALVSALALVLCLVPGKYTFADSVSVKPFLAFGADLSTKEKAQVMKQFGITNE